MDKKTINVNQVHKQSLTNLEKFAIVITDKVGSMGFFILIFLWTSIWLFWNILAPESLRFDPYPAFVVWLFISNMIQIFLMPLIMIGQNLQARHAELRAERHYNADIRADKNVEEIKKMLAEQNILLNKILEKIEK
jgi:uncharacterized membrane protein